MTVIPDEYLHSICEVKSMNNILLASGRLSEITKDFIKLENPGDAITILKFGTRVKVNILNSQMKFLSVVGNVYLSTQDFMQITDVCSIAEAEKRSFYRVSTDLPGIVSYKANEDVKQADVRIENVSLCGTLFSGEIELNKDLLVDLLLMLPTGNIQFKCKIHRIESAGLNQQKYGCEFSDPDERLLDQLWIYILQKQSQEIRLQKRARDYD